MSMSHILFAEDALDEDTGVSVGLDEDTFIYDESLLSKSLLLSLLTLCCVTWISWSSLLLHPTLPTLPTFHCIIQSLYICYIPPRHLFKLHLSVLYHLIHLRKIRDVLEQPSHHVWPIYLFLHPKWQLQQFFLWLLWSPQNLHLISKGGSNNLLVLLPRLIWIHHSPLFYSPNLRHFPPLH